MIVARPIAAHVVYWDSSALVKLYVQELVEIQERFGTHFEISGRALGVIHGDRARTCNDLRNGTLRNA